LTPYIHQGITILEFGRLRCVVPFSRHVFSKGIPRPVFALDVVANFECPSVAGSVAAAFVLNLAIECGVAHAGCPPSIHHVLGWKTETFCVWRRASRCYKACCKQETATGRQHTSSAADNGDSYSATLRP
jgi:hypothetical protein